MTVLLLGNKERKQVKTEGGGDEEGRPQARKMASESRAKAQWLEGGNGLDWDTEVVASFASL